MTHTCRSLETAVVLSGLKFWTVLSFRDFCSLYLNIGQFKLLNALPMSRSLGEENKDDPLLDVNATLDS